MNFERDFSDLAFQKGVRDVLAAAMRSLFPGDSDGRHREYTRAERQHWWSSLDDRGWAVPHWPPEWGGTGWHKRHCHLFAQELWELRCPHRDVIGCDLAAPAIFSFGTPSQRERYLPKIRRCEELWCQGFSEPEAGSDVTSLRTAAVRSGANFVVNGTKLWTTNAHEADMMFALVRIDGVERRRAQGLSFLLIDMRSAGITVKPIVTIDSRHTLNEVNLQDVYVPLANLVGQEGRGWAYAQAVLSNERRTVTMLSYAKERLELARSRLSRRQAESPGDGEVALLLRRLGELWAECQALEFMDLRLMLADEGDPAGQLLGPVLKLRGCELRQKACELLLDSSGPRALEAPGFGPAGPTGDAPEHDNPFRLETEHYLFQRAATIAGGTSEIQRNLIASLILGL